MSIRKILTNLNKSIPIPNYINGKFESSHGKEIVKITNPHNNKGIGSVVMDDNTACFQAMENSRQAYQKWSLTSINSRLELLANWKNWLINNRDTIASIINEENGKPIADARAEIERGLEVVTFAFSAPSLLKGDYSIINNNLDIYQKRQPLGVTTGIMPFNFPAMIPLWMIPLAIVTGNSIIIKSSEKCPSTPLYLAYGATRSGIPDGVINVIHGNKYITENLISNGEVEAVSFVGSTEVGKQIYNTASKYGKRTQINMGAKNHAIVMPSCNHQDTVNSIISGFVMGQRCMAISVLVVVEGAEDIIPLLLEGLKQINPVNDMGPLISPEAKNGVIEALKCSVMAGAEIIYGDYQKVINNNEGNYLEPIVVDKVNINMSVYRQELFAPVLSIIRVKNLDDAIELVNKNEYGNGTSIFTSNIEEAKRYENLTNVTQCGINVPIPVSPPYYSWTSGKDSFIGSHYIYGPSSFDFYTRPKNVMCKHGISSKIAVSMPTN